MLDEYSAALNDTIYQLHGISSELCLKSRGEEDYPYRRYRADLDSYKESVERYRQIGGSSQRSAPKDGGITKLRHYPMPTYK